VVYFSALLNPEIIEGTYLYKLKKKLIEKLKNRFSLFITWKKETDKEFFPIQPYTEGEWENLVKRWSYQFIPWQTECAEKEFDKTLLCCYWWQLCET
jgi:hypothetical protein